MKACDWSGHIFGASACPRSVTEKLAIYVPRPLFLAVSMIPNMHNPHEYEQIWRIPDKSMRRISTIRPRASTCPRFLVGVLVHTRRTNTCPMCCRGYSSIGWILALCFGEGIRPRDEYLPHFLERVFVHGTYTCPMFWRGYLSNGRILASWFGDGIRPRTNTFLLLWRGYSSEPDE